MRSLWLLTISFVFLVFCSRRVAGQQDLSIADIPACGLECLLQTVPEAGCSLTNTTCQCESKQLAQLTAACILANCTMAVSLQTAKVQASLCHLESPSKTGEVLACTITVLAVTTVFMGLRLISKVISRQFSWNDGVIALAMIISALPAFCIISMADSGFGKHLWDLDDGDLLEMLRYFYIAELSYVLILGMIKVSILLFYLTIFQSYSFKVAAWTTFGFIVLTNSIVFFLTVFGCKPIQYFWNRDLHGTCLDLNALAYVNSSLAIVQDIIILIMPLSVVHKLNMNIYKKFAVGAMFAVGSFGCIMSIVRLRSLLVFGNSIDPSWDYVPVVFWTALELAAGFICNCLPSIRKLFSKMFPKIPLSDTGDFSENSRTIRMSTQSVQFPYRDSWNKTPMSPSHRKSSFPLEDIQDEP